MMNESFLEHVKNLHTLILHEWENIKNDILDKHFKDLKKLKVLELSGVCGINIKTINKIPNLEKLVDVDS